MAVKVKQSAEKIVADFCEPIIHKTKNETDTTAPAQEVITHLAIAKIHSDQQHFEAMGFENRFTDLNRDTKTFAGESSQLTLTPVKMMELPKINFWTD